MKKFPFLLVLLSMTALTFQSCFKDKCERTITYTRIDPVYKSLEEVHSGTAVREAPRELKTPGQINYYNNRMFIVESGEGVHVIDNSNPAYPVNTDFIKVPGISDLAIKDDYLFVNSYVDLLVINLNSYVVDGRAENVLQPLWMDIANNQIIVEYKETQVTEVMDCDEQGDLRHYNGGWFKGGFGMDDVAFDLALANSSESSSGGNVGIGGSLSHFTIIGDYLYTIQHDGYDLNIYDLTNPTNPTHASTVGIGVHLETLFPYGDKLFVGSNVGMYIYDNSNPLNPVQLSVFEHARACDPVFVQGNYAYVTLWDGSSCGSAGPNQLDVIDITDLLHPVLKKSFAMKNPHGLSVKGNSLLLCEGMFGLEIYDNTNPETVGDHLLDKAENFFAQDVISLPGSSNVAMVIGEDGFYQFDFNNPSDLKLLSVIPIAK
ncbi:MAG: hypothetical protein K9J37_02030 [Saprospiraceae bacterium]|nr:hypothetical protein [Saprospiraceae bacterium]MCF8248657.1 hypothetical protein [Saprospiraceae bacterium]MCF8278853.1 hypothetical protein [Bacteroidales bacterium]MCF8310653.1 hypothetical protein [Saprospiraceae bacterium]MCF8439212.1 hypothetical protein [Saprospiraceae bacterium]